MIWEIIQSSDWFPKVLSKEDPALQLGIDYEIHLTSEGKVSVLPIICLNPPKLENLKKQLVFLLEQWWIQLSQSPYSAPVLFARKKDRKLCMYVDYRALNKLTEE